MKYMLKKIIIGVAIGTALMYIKTSNVFASTYNLNNNDVSIAIMYKFDVCLYDSGNLLCQEGINDTTALHNTNSQTIYTTKENEFLFLKEFSYEISFTNSVNFSSDISLPRPLNFFTSPDFTTIFPLPNTPTGYNQDQLKTLTTYNYSSNFSYSNFIYNLTYENTNGVLNTCNDFGIERYTSSWVNTIRNVVNDCSFTGMRNLYVTFRPTSTYNGPLDSLLFFNNYHLLTGTLSQRIEQMINTYMLVVPPKTTLRINPKSTIGSITYGTSINYSYPPVYSEVSISINDAMSELNKEIIMSQFVIGPSNATNDDLAKFNTDYSGLANGISDLMNNGNNGNFTTFLNSTVGLPVYYLNQSANTDLGPGLCYSQQYQEVHHGFIRLWKFSSSHDQDYLEFQLPCLIRDYYPYLKDKGSGYSMLGTSSNAFQYWWLIIQHGILYYFLVLTCLNVFKYTISNSKAEFEVFEL